MNLSEISPVILTHNESSNIEQALKCLLWAKEVVIVDSCSDDETQLIASRYSNVRFLTRPFDTHATQWNFAVSQASSEWILTLDADYILSEGFINELSKLSPTPDLVGYFAPFIYCVYGNPLHGSLLPPRCLLFRSKRAHYLDDGHTQRLTVSGVTGMLNKPVLHDDRKTLLRWLKNQGSYAALEAEKLYQTSFWQLSTADKLRRAIIITPWLAPIWALFVRRTILDGLPGFYYALQRCIAEAVISLALIERRMRGYSGPQK